MKSDGKWLQLCLMEHIPSCHNTLLFPFLPPHARSQELRAQTHTGQHLPANPHPPFSSSQELQPRGTGLCPTLSLLSASDFCCPTWEDMAQPAEIFNAAWDAADEPIPTATTPSLLSFHWVALCLPNEVNEINLHRWM